MAKAEKDAKVDEALKQAIEEGTLTQKEVDEVAVFLKQAVREGSVTSEGIEGYLRAKKEGKLDSILQEEEEPRSTEQMTFKEIGMDGQQPPPPVGSRMAPG